MRLKFTTSGRGELAVGHIGRLHRGATVFLQVRNQSRKLETEITSCCPGTQRIEIPRDPLR
jgi:hypothetical protein